MIVKTIQRNVVESHDFKSEIATIDANEMRYISSLLRNNYSNTVLATVRETFANALDANKQTGSVKPVKIKAPTRLDPSYSVRDYGLGLSESDLFGLYTKYGRSTKRNDNTSIGGFGIGRFAPLSYTDSFTVISCHKGTEIIISVYVDEHGDTRFTKINERETTESSGVEIIVAVKSEDIYSFENEISNVVQFCTEPFSCSLKTSKIDWLMKNAVWGVSKTRNHSGEPLIVMGGLSYPLNLDPMKTHPIAQSKIFKNFYSSYANQNFVFFFPVGAVSLHHSREALEYNAATKNFIANAIQTLEKDIHTQVQNELNPITDSSEFFSKIRSFVSSNSILAFCQGLKFIFNSPDGKISVDTSEIAPDAIFKLTSRTGNIVRVPLQNTSRYGNSNQKTISPLSLDRHLLVDDKVKNISGRAHAILAKNPDSVVYVLSKDVAESNFLTKYSKSEKIVYASKIAPLSPKQKQDANNFRKIYSSSEYVTFRTRCEVPTDDFYYLKLTTNGVAPNGRNYQAAWGGQSIDSYALREIALCASKLDIPAKEIYGVVDATSLPANAIDFYAVFMEKFNTKKEQYKSFFNLQRENGIRKSKLEPRYFESLTLPKDHIISQYVEKCAAQPENGIDTSSANDFFDSVPNFLKSSSSDAEEFLELSKKIDQEVLTIKEKYPMIFQVIDNRGWYWSGSRSSSGMNEWKNYIDLVDKSQS